MRKSKHALLVLAALIPLLTGCAGTKSESESGSVPEPTVLKAYTLEEALDLCDTLPSDLIADCRIAANATPWGE